MEEKFYTIEETAKKLGLTYKTIYRYIRNKKLKATKIGYWRIYEKDLSGFIERGSNIYRKK